MAEDLRADLDHRVVLAYETGALAELRKGIARNTALAATLGVVLAMLVLGGAAFVARSGPAAGAQWSG